MENLIFCPVGVTEQEVVLLVFTCSKTYQSVTKFFDVATPEVSQDVSGLKEAILTAFKQHDLELVLGKLVFCRQMVHL